MTKTERLKAIASSKHFKTCQLCKFVYLPMTKWTAKRCPKCEPMEHKQVEYVDPDITYISNEVMLEENVNIDHINEGWGMDYNNVAL